MAAHASDHLRYGNLVKFNLRNRIRQIPLAADQALRPVYEAVSNAFDAINETGEPAGCTVTVRIIRGEPDPKLFTNGERPQGPIIGFEIKDDGIGFTDDNYNAFREAHTEKKAAKGGLGVGRLLWLKAFEYAEIDSTYVDDESGKLARRRFRFDEVKDVRPVEGDERARSSDGGTVVKLMKLRKKYRCPASVDTIARHLIQHNLEEMLASEGVAFDLEDPDAGRIDLRAVFKSEFGTASKSIELSIGDHKFRIRHFLVRASGCIDAHKFHFCARNQCVTEEKIARYIPDLRGPLLVDGEPTYYLGTIRGDYLDELVNDSRTAFAIPDDPTLTEDLTTRQIADAVAKKVQDYLQSHLSELTKHKTIRARSVVAEKAPELRTVVDRHPNIVERFAVDASDRDILTTVAGQNYDDRDELKKMQGELLKLGNAGDKLEATKTALIERYASESAIQGAVALGQLVCHRRAVLDVLGQLVACDDSFQFQKEEAIHQLVFPLRKTSDEVPPTSANLWVIDERLAFHHYLASDLRLDKLSPIQVGEANGKEPDLIIFDQAFATTTKPESPGAITIIEFKRPGRSQYDQEKNPWDQLVEYVNRILDGKARTRDNRPFMPMAGTRFFGYIIADMHPNLVAILKRRGFIEGFGPESMYKYEPGIRLSAEAYSYKALIEDAIKRNHAFFSQLGIADA